MAHWLEQMEECDFNIVYRQGKLHTNADALSRLPHVNMEGNETSDLCCVSCSHHINFASPDIRSEQLQNDLVGPFCRPRKVIFNHPQVAVGLSGGKWFSFGISYMLIIEFCIVYSVIQGI